MISARMVLWPGAPDPQDNGVGRWSWSILRSDWERCGFAGRLPSSGA